MLSTIEQDFNIKILRSGKIPTEFYFKQFSRLNLIKEEFPWIKNIIGIMKEEPKMRHSIMNVRPIQATKKVEIHVSIPQCKNPSKLGREYQEGVESKWHPKNSTYEDTLIHEIGHALSYSLSPSTIDGKFNYKKWIEIENSIISDSINTLENIYKLAHKSTKEWRTTVCRYAGESNTECIAESFVDYIVNGKDCSDLTKEIIKNIKYRLYTTNPF